MNREKDRRCPLNLGWLVAATCLLVSACNREETAPEPAVVTSASAASLSPEQTPLKDYCEKSCKRASECGLERAKALAQIGGGADKDLVGAAEKHQKEHYFRCKRGCEEKPVRDADRPLYGKAVSCLSETDCKLYEKCLNAVDRPPTPASSAASDSSAAPDSSAALDSRAAPDGSAAPRSAAAGAGEDE
ncbi:MAG: hypothetical protein H6716_17285 [Polyangiaceae bacterium]|nr:hypothetical protein [Polyangiaceae bacterium]